MTTERQNKLRLFIAQRGSGKTSICYEYAKRFMQHNSTNKIIVVDTDSHPFYNQFTNVGIDEIASCKSRLIRCEDAREDELFTTLNASVRNAFVIFEDAGKYINSNITNAVKSAIIDMRKRNFEFAFMFHYLGEIPPYIAKNYNELILFKTGDNYLQPQHKFLNWHVIKEKGLQLQKSKNMHDHTVIKM